MKVALVDHLPAETVKGKQSSDATPQPLTPQDIIEMDHQVLLADILAIKALHDKSWRTRGKMCTYKLLITLPNCQFAQRLKKRSPGESSKVASRLEIHPGLDELTLRCCTRRIDLPNVTVKEPEWVPYDNGRRRYYIIEVVVWP